MNQNDNYLVDMWNESVLSSCGIREEPTMINLMNAIQYFIAPDCYAMMRKVGVNRVTIFNQACREAFKLNDQTKYADALRAYANHLDETGILPETLEG